MMRLVVTGSLAWLIVATLFAQPAGLDADFSRLEEVWNTAHRNADADALAALWADDLEVDVPRMAPMSKSEALAFVRTGHMRFERYDTSDLRVRRYLDTAVVTGRLQRSYTLGGNRRQDDWRFTKVYVRQNGAWRVVSFHASDAPTQ
jgi:ketosteroid isomerase-like protein